MGKKLLSVFLPVFFIFLGSWSGFGQCPSSVSISASPGTTICAGTEVTFTANPTGGTNVQYQWQLNSSPISGATSSTYKTTSLANGAKIRVIVTSSTETCTATSNELTMTVNSLKTPTVSVTPSKTSICPGENVTYTAANTNGGSSPQYSFFLNNQTSALQTGSSNTYSSTTLNNGDFIRVVLTSNLDCVTSKTAEANSNTITVRSGTPETPGTIGTSVGTEICPGTSQTYSISAVAGAASYQWTLPSGWSGTSNTTSINVTAGTSSGSVSVKAINDCGTSDAQSISITIKTGTPAVPGAITGEVSVCPGVDQTYSISAVSGATEYIWSLPNGWTGTSTTNSISVTPGVSGSGSISVQAKNDCGTSAEKTLAVSVKPGIPAQPGTISGTAAVCPGIQETYSINAVTDATSYLWTLPNGWTGSSTTNTITVTTGTTGGDISVKALNDCGTGTERTLAVTVKPGTPATPNLISGANNVCPGTTETYSISPVSGATEYIWTLPSGWNGTSTSETISVTTGASGSGNITVKAKNDCGTSTAANISVTVTNPAPVMTGTITGESTVCSTATGLVYSIPAITNATEYVWSLPNGWSGSSTTNSITVSASSSSGNISVIAKNICGESSPSAAFAVNSTVGKPNTPGTISAPNLPTNAICPPATGIEFTVPTVTGAQSYLWTLPNGWEITSGNGTNTIVVKVNSTAATTDNASVSVQAVNICGNSEKSTLSGIAIDNHVVTNAGADKTVCKIIASIDIVGDYSFSGTNKNLKPTWSVGSGMGSFGDASKTTTTFTPTQAALDAGKVVLTLTTDAPSGACGPGKDEMTIFFKPLPTATITATSPICSGNTATLTFTGTPNSKVTYKLPGGNNQTIDIGSSGTATVTTAALTANSTYSLVSSVNLDSPACTFTFPASASTTVMVTPKPTATITYDAPFCNSLTTGQNPTLTGTNAYTGGSYSSTSGLTIDTASGAITPSSSTPGTYTITYSTPQGGGCDPVTATTQVTITKAPTASLSYAGIPFCTSDTATKPVSLTGTDGFSGGTFSAPTGLTIDSNTGAITPSSSTAGTYTVTYHIPAAGGCASLPFTTEVTITKAPTVAISYPDAPFCLSDPLLKPVTITGTDAFTGGTYSAPSGLSINSSTGEINPASSTSGTYTVNYITPATSGCGEVTATTDIIITQTPAAEISYAGPFCNNDETAKSVTFNNTAGAYEGGSFAASTSGLSINNSTGEINAKDSSPGQYTVVYTLPTGNGCPTSEISTTIVITQSPKVDISYTTPLCSSDSAAYSVTFSNGTGAYEGGTFTGTNGLSIDANGNITPESSTAGVHTVTYTTVAAEGCGTFETTTEVEIFKEVTITTEPVNVGICSTESASFEVVASGDNLTYQWKRTDGATITNATGVTTSKISFSNATSVNAGEYFVEVYGSSPCEMAKSEPVTLNIDENIIIIKPTEDLEFCHQDRQDVTFEFIAHANGAELEFTWIKDGADIPNMNTDRFKFNRSEPEGENGQYTGTFQILDPNPSDNGVYAVRINGPDYFTCSDAVSKTFNLNVNPLPEPPTTANVVYCQNEEPSPLTVTGENGASFTWYDLNMDKLDGVPTPPTSEAGTITYYVTQTTEVCESDPSELAVTIKPTPAAPTTSQSISYCHNEVSTPLTATGANSSSTLNWYGPDDQNDALTEAPTPLTTTTGIIKYWVSETFEGCESPLVEIIVNVNTLPGITVTAEATIVCKGSSTVLKASGGNTYEWFQGETLLGSESELTVSPELETIYTVVGTNDSGCKNSAEVTIQVDENTIAGTITGPESVCVSSPTGTLNLSGNTGDIQRWESSEDGGVNWTQINNTTIKLEFANLSKTTTFRAVVKSGVCDEMSTNEIEVIIDPIPVGGELAFGEFGRMFITCESPNASSLVDLNLSGVTGKIELWEYKPASQNNWTTITEGSENYTELSLTANKIASLNLQETTAFRVKIVSGACEAFANSQTGILSIISSEIKPTPVTVDKEVICIDESVTLSASTGYEAGQEIGDRGDFDNASIDQHGWRIQKNGINEGFSTSASNTRPDIWRRVTPRNFITANINNNSTSLQLFDPGIDDGNKGFAIVSGNNASTMETPVFSITAMDQAILQFDQAYNLTAGATVSVEISTDGGATYNTVLFSVTGPASSGNYSSFGTGTTASRPLNKMEIDLGNYLGMGNLRIRFNYEGVRDGDVWTLDGIKVPDGPANIGTVWKDYTQDPENPTVIGTNPTETWKPTEIGWNSSVIITTLEYSNGSCETAVNSEEIKVFVFDTYNTSITANTGSCGVTSAQLAATVTGAKQGEITSYPTKDKYIGQWEVTGPEGYSFSNPEGQSGEAINNPNAIFTANDLSNYTITWVLIPTEEDANGDIIEPTCSPEFESYDLVFEPCIALDFDGDDDYVDLGENYQGAGYSFEAWVKPETAGGTIVSGKEFNITAPGNLTLNQWAHIAVTDEKLYINGVESGNAPTDKGGDKALIGARWENGAATDFFHGWIEEVRIWNKVLDSTQIRFMMNQRLQNEANIGELIPMPVPGALTYDNLAGYYRLISGLPDPANLVEFAADLKPLNGLTIDLAANAVPGKLMNMTTNQENTAPLPYFSGSDGAWDTAGTWARPTVWKIPNTGGIDWNIVQTSHNVKSGLRDITVLGLLSKENTLNMEGANPTSGTASGTGSYLRITHYFKLDGIVDLNGESQLLQDMGSIVDAASVGNMERDQQGTASSYNYNYWSSPLSPGTGNADYTIGGVLRDGTNPAAPGEIEFGASHAHADAAYNGRKKISNYWLHRFRGRVNEYSEWVHIGSTGDLNVGEGFTMKGTSGQAAIEDSQNYVFVGKPNNGTINLEIATEQNYLLGNPYASAISVADFIRDNLKDVTGGNNTKNIFNGSVYFWEHFAGKTHILKEYIGGYAARNLTGGVPAASIDERINANEREGNKIPGLYIPVAQGFFINTTLHESVAGTTVIHGGNVVFKNSQRAFVPDIDRNVGDAVFLKPGVHSKQAAKADTREKIRLSYKSPLGYNRQILVGSDPNTSADFDLGYDALLNEDNVEDMYWVQGNNWLVIQGVPHFEKNQVLPVGVKLKKKGEFTIQIEKLENFADAKEVYLHDKANDTIHDLRKSPYKATAEGGYHNERFEVIFYKEVVAEGPPVVTKPIDESPGKEDPDDLYGVTDLTIRHSHTRREFQILNPDQLPISYLYVFDINGSLLSSYKNLSREKEVRVPVKNFNAGVYILKLYSENRVISKKIIINN